LSGASALEEDENGHAEGNLPVKNSLGTKLYYSISEVAEITGLQPYTLRAWEKEFACLRPRRARGKNRAYREKDIGIIMLIKQLLYQERYTTQGVKQKLKSEPQLLRQVSGGTGTVLPTGEEGPSPEEKAAVPLAKDQAPPAYLKEAIEAIRRDLQEVLRLL
jgi:DNA-binding transcriptional MerR regulator